MFKVLALISLALTFASLILLMTASIGVPWDRQTIDGTTPFETRRKARQTSTLFWGTALGGIAILIQAVVVLFGETG